MWLPCNFGETIRVREHMGYDMVDVTFYGLGTTPFKTVEYLFKDDKGRQMFMDKENLISFWPTAFNNLDCYDPSSLNDGEIQLVFNIYDIVHYNKYFFETKSRAQGELIALYQRNNCFEYYFHGADGLAKNFYVPELLIKEPFRAYKDDPLLQ